VLYLCVYPVPIRILPRLALPGAGPLHKLPFRRAPARFQMYAQPSYFQSLPHSFALFSRNSFIHNVFPNSSGGIRPILLPRISVTENRPKPRVIIDFAGEFARAKRAPRMPAPPHSRRKWVPRTSVLRVSSFRISFHHGSRFHRTPASLSARGVPAKLLGLRTANNRALTDGR
jgi:hypothetical protein